MLIDKQDRYVSIWVLAVLKFHEGKNCRKIYLRSFFMLPYPAIIFEEAG
jgi:hypothetical protein